jgi:hypothetical protein
VPVYSIGGASKEPINITTLTADQKTRDSTCLRWYRIHHSAYSIAYCFGHEKEVDVELKIIITKQKQTPIST